MTAYMVFEKDGPRVERPRILLADPLGVKRPFPQVRRGLSSQTAGAVYRPTQFLQSRPGRLRCVAAPRRPPVQQTRRPPANDPGRDSRAGTSRPPLEIGRAHVLNSSHEWISYAVF